jgi:phosphotransferase system  glucose/maltose/N-acetylglucosamine-specific IIC component
MDSHIFIALVGALVNAGLSVTVPCLVKNSEQPFLKQIKQVFDTNRQVIITSSLIVAITIYLALQIAPEIQPTFSELTGLSLDSSSSTPRLPMVVSTRQLPQDLKNLLKLVRNQ